MFSSAAATRNVHVLAVLDEAAVHSRGLLPGDTRHLAPAAVAGAGAASAASAAAAFAPAAAPVATTAQQLEAQKRAFMTERIK